MFVAGAHFHNEADAQVGHEVADLGSLLVALEGLDGNPHAEQIGIDAITAVPVWASLR
jgi:hypothetical protein